MNSVVFRRQIQKMTKLLVNRKKSCDLFFFTLDSHKVVLSFLYVEGKGGTLFCTTQDKKIPLFSYLEDGSGFYNIEKYKVLEKYLIKIEKDNSFISHIINELF